MKEILDQNFEEKAVGGLYAKLSFGLAVFTFGLFVVARIWVSFSSIEMQHLLVLWFSRGLEVTVLLGVIFSITSLIRKEKLKYLKWIGIGLNLVYLMVILGFLVYYLTFVK